MVPVRERLGTGLRDIASEWLNPDLPVSRACALDSLPHSDFQEEHELAWGRGGGHSRRGNHVCKGTEAPKSHSSFWGRKGKLGESGSSGF